MSPRLGLTFHRTFSLVRPAVSQVVQLAATLGQSDAEGVGLTSEMIRAGTDLGTIYVEAMPRYARGAGLLDSQNRLTSFGHHVLLSDLGFDRTDTQWLMHYCMSAAEGSGPRFWHELCATRFRMGNRFTRQAIADDIAALYAADTGKTISPSALKSTTTIFLGTYLKSDGLGKLGILGQEGDTYVVLPPEPPSPWVVAYALMQEWETRFPGRLSINFDDLNEPRGFVGLFLMDGDALTRTLTVLQREGIVDLYRSAPPYQLLLLAQDQDAILRRLYGNDDSRTLA